MTEYPQFCAIARAAEIIGQRWTLLIIRELYLGPRRYSDLLDRLRPIAPGVLSGRLRSLEEEGIIARKEAPPPTPARLFELTETGRALEPALFELLRWGARFLYPQRAGERFEVDWLRMVLMAYGRRTALPPVVLALRVRTHGTEGMIWVEGTEDGVVVSGTGEGEAATITTTLEGVFGMLSGPFSLADAVAQSRARVDGDMAAATAIEGFFGRDRA